MGLVDNLIETGFKKIKLDHYYQTHQTFQKLVKFTLVAGGGYVLNLPLMALFIAWGIHWAISNLFSAAIVMVCKFVVENFWVFGRHQI